jgi:hypothetical protein
MRIEIRGRIQSPLEHELMGIYVVGAGFIPACSCRFTIGRA